MWESMGCLFGQKLRYLRTRNKLTQVELAQQLQLASHAHVSNLEHSRFEPSLDLVISVAQLFTVPIEVLVRDESSIEENAGNALDELSIGTTSLDAHSFGPNLTRLRTQAKKTQAQLAEQLGLAAHAHVSFLESGKKLPSIDLLLRVAEVFDVSTDMLLSTHL